MSMLICFDIIKVLIPTGILVLIGGLFALLISYLSKKLAVKRDERIDEVIKNLTGANCGACGHAGCDAFATALVKGEASISDCPSTPKENKEKIANILGVEDIGEETVCVVNCRGGNYCKDKFDYQGYGNCQSQELLAGGRKQCPVGCMGMGSCTDSCPEHAIDVTDEGYAKIDKEKCIACGLCMAACPKHLISRIPKAAKVYVACSNNCKGKDVRGICEHGCIGCGMCAKVCDQGAITLENNLPKIDYSKCIGCLKCVEKCPVKCMTELK